jgi:hypothetical protein
MSLRANRISVSKYSPEYKKLWDDFVSNSKNGIFLFYRDYMEYHSDRFCDHSLLFFKNRTLMGLLPANIRDDTLYSHGGLTFGGVISGYNMRIPLMLDIFEKLVEHCKEERITEILYKAIPYIYHSIPADEDLYALFRYNAKLVGRNVTTSIYLPSKLKFDESRARAIKKAQKNNLVVKRSYDFRRFMQIVENVLVERHGTKPVHTPEEIELLASRFSGNIKLFSSYKNDVMVAGVIMYESRNVAHAQYIANSNEGRDIGAEEVVFDYLINDYYKAKRYFDFGISTEQTGQFLNVGLVRHKEGFGARAAVHDFYQLSL